MKHVWKHLSIDIKERRRDEAIKCLAGVGAPYLFDGPNTIRFEDPLPWEKVREIGEALNSVVQTLYIGPACIARVDGAGILSAEGLNLEATVSIVWSDRYTTWRAHIVNAEGETTAVACEEAFEAVSDRETGMTEQAYDRFVEMGLRLPAQLRAVGAIEAFDGRLL